MKKLVVFGSTMGVTEEVANKIGEKLGAEVVSVDNGLSSVKDYDVVLLGSSTWGYGELQDSWEGAIDELKGIDFSNKYVGFFGSGDQMAYNDTFCDALGLLKEGVNGDGVKFVGEVANEGYEFGDSKALSGDKLIGLCVDENNQGELTDSRIDEWVAQVEKDVV